MRGLLRSRDAPDSTCKLRDVASERVIGYRSIAIAVTAATEDLTALATAGLSAVIALTVSARRRELASPARGAGRFRLRAVVVREGLLLVGVGVGLGYWVRWLSAARSHNCPSVSTPARPARLHIRGVCFICGRIAA